MGAARRTMVLVAVPLLMLVSAAAVLGFTAGGSRWSADERDALRSLSLASLGALEADPGNRYADDRAAAALGHQLFFDRRMSSTGKVSCATCHIPDQGFQDGIALAQGVGTTSRRSMPIAGTAHSPWQFWDGRSDSQWAQALGPLESPVEHGGDRTQYAHHLAAAYRAEYERVFGPMPSLRDLPAEAGPVPDTARAAAWRQIPAQRREEISRVYANIGKAIAAYERTIEFTPSRFDRYVEVEVAGGRHTPESALTRDEEAGLRLFIGKANCMNCHNGALFTDNHFHNTGVAVAPGLPPDSGRATGARQAVQGEFSCTGAYSDAKPDDCVELRFAVTEGPELVRAFKTPSLRNVDGRGPFMHAGQIETLEAVVRHYNLAPEPPFGQSELERLHLSEKEQRQIVAFLRTLTSPLKAPPGYLAEPGSVRSAN